MPRLVLLVALALLAASGARSQSCTTTYLPAEVGVDSNGDPIFQWRDGAWDDEDRWSDGVPTAADTACVFGDMRASFTVSSSAPREVGGLRVGSTASGVSPRVVFGAPMTVRGRGRLIGNDRIDGALVIRGRFEIEDGDLISGGGTVTVARGGTLAIVPSGGEAGNGNASTIGTLQSNGEALQLRGGRLEVGESASVYARLEVDGGTVAVREDGRDGNRTTVRMRSPGNSLTDLTLDTDAETTLTLRGDYAASGVIGGVANGVVELSRFGSLEVATSGIEFAVGGALGFALSNNEPGAAAELTVTGGEILNSGLLRLARRPILSGVTVRSTGTLRADGAGGAILANGADIIVERAGTLLFTDALGQGNRQISGTSPHGASTEERVVVRGRIVAAGNNAADRIAVPMEVNGGTLQVTSGLLRLEGGGRLVNADVRAASGARLQFSRVWDVEGTLSGLSAATPTPFEDEISILFAGLTSDPIAFRAVGDVVLDVDGAGIEIGASGGTTVVTAASGGTITSRSPILQKSSVTLRAVTLRNESEVSGGGFRLEDNARFVNASGGVATLRSGVVLGDGTGAFVNDGLVQTNQPGSSLTFRGLLDSRPGSELRVTQEPGAGTKTLNLSQEAPEAYGAGVTLSGRGRVSNGSFSTRIFGTVSPGTPEAPVDTLSFASFKFAETGGAPRFVVDITPEGTDFVSTGDGSSLVAGGATLVLRVADGFTPQPGTEWVVAREFGSNPAPPGAFAAMEVEGAPDGIAFVQDPDVPGAVVVRAVLPVGVAASEPEVAEGASGAFVLTHGAFSETVAVEVETGGTATRFADYTLGATGGLVRILPNTTRTVIPVIARRDDTPGEGPETVTLRLRGGASGEATLTLADGPSSDALAIGGVFPARGATPGTVTPTVYGTGFGTDAEVRLTGPATVTGAQPSRASGGAGVSATFDLAGAPAGTYDVVATSGGQTATLPGAFRVIGDLGGLRLSGSVSGTSAPRVDRRSTYTVRVTNSGDTDLYDALVLVRVTNGVAYSVSGIRNESDPAPNSTGPGLPSGAEVIPVYLHKIPAGATLSARVGIVPSRGFLNEFVGVAAELYPPNPDATVTYTGRTDDILTDIAAGRWTVWSTIWGSFELAMQSLASGTAQPLGATAFAGLAPEASGDDCNGSNGVQGRGDPFADLTRGDISQLNRLYSSQARYHFYRSEIELNTPNPTSEFLGYGLGTFVTGGVGLLEAAGVISIGVGAFPIVAAGVIGMATLYIAGQSLSRIKTSFDEEPCAGGVVGGSFDPNDKLGPAGVLAERYYVPRGPTPYTIRFENLATTSFPAQEVVITDTLDTDVFDLSTFRFGAITYGENGRLTPPLGATQFEAEVSLAPEAPATLLVTASLDAETGRAVWRFATLDPTTGDLPEDGTIGFLPPNVNAPEGEGSVEFSVQTRDGLPTGTQVSNGAEIVFDVNEPIVTPVWTNTVDVLPPMTGLDALADQSQAPFQITASGGDAGSGVSRWVLFAQRDGGDFEIVAESAEPRFTFDPPEPGAYGFYIRAVDRVGNAEGPKTEAEATTMVAVDAEGAPQAPLALTLEAPHPNPARGVVRLRYGLPASGHATVRVLDALGREVAVLASGEAAAGWHTATWTPRVASGVYVVRVTAGAEAQTQTLTVVR